MRFHTYIALLLLAVGCTNNHKSFPQYMTAFGPTNLVASGDMRFQSGSTQTLTMTTKGNSLYLTGRPFGFIRADIGMNPASPQLVFAASDQIDTFSPSAQFGGWVVDWFASGALQVIANRFALMSGSAGMSVINLQDTNRPQEVRRYPMSTGVLPTPDQAFIYKAMTIHPNYPLIYGFRENDYLYVLDGSRLPDVSIISKHSYVPNSTTCCVRGAAYFRNMLLVGMSNKLWIVQLSSNGQVQGSSEFAGLAATNVVATSRYAYIQHEPQGASAYPAGIYAFDVNGVPAGYFGITPYSFAVNDNDSYLYANEDDSAVRIYQLPAR